MGWGQYGLETTQQGLRDTQQRQADAHQGLGETQQRQREAQQALRETQEPGVEAPPVALGVTGLHCLSHSPHRL